MTSDEALDLLVGSISTIIPSSYAVQDLQKIECVDDNLNINGIDLNQLTQQQQDQIKRLAGIDYEEADTLNSNYNDNDYGLSDDSFNVDNNLVNVCANLNVNEQIDSDAGGGIIETNPDLAVANFGSNYVSILLGKGDGTFGAGTNFAAGVRSEKVAVGDFNGDTNLDLVLANFGISGVVIGGVTVLLGDGTGLFGTPNFFLAGNSPFSVAVGDFNRDTNLDLAVPDFSSTGVSILLGDGSGLFGPATSFAVASAPFFVAVGDFNNDMNQDLAVTNRDTDNVSILLGDGTGLFGPANNFAVGNGAYSVAVGDFNSDKNQDLSVVNRFSDNVSILLGDGTGSFGPANNFAVGDAGDEPSSVVVGEFDGL